VDQAPAVDGAAAVQRAIGTHGQNLYIAEISYERNGCCPATSQI
jgi:hypothetical protein